jgi:probable rRNA maturation factor
MSPDDPPLLFRGAPKGLDRRSLRAFHDRLRTEVANDRAFTCLISGDEELRRLNREFLGNDYPTDVLSFPDPEGSEALGELAISGRRAAEQAAEFGHEIETEIKILMLHGVLHLLGYDHERDRGRMAREEARLRTRFGLPAGLIERVR